MAVIVKIVKDKDLGREIYCPNYDPKKSEESETVIVSKEECKIK